MSLFAILAAWIALATVATVSPGPDTALVIAQSVRCGRRAGLMVALGIGVGNLWYALLFGFGLMSLLAAQPMVYTVVKIVGAAYLAWIGFKMVRAAIAGTAHDAPVSANGSPFVQGFVTNILNPKIALFFLAAIPQFAGNGPDAPAIGVALIVINGVINMLWLSIVAAGVERAGAKLQQSNVMRWLEGIIGFALMGIATRVALSRNH